ncbi:hypothetical protein AAFF_G00275530 [Aldrovandia affinis]|uniref:C2H2-type domain-containing protein n=1 Tax=Aldrovandia affinis TaxID=143900 RepID=A0AAD7WSE5_9TELE|nr:hypothetical protein AAFF_G00275530 [Aldrovandia affinis]
MPRRKQDQPKRLPSHVDGVEEGGAKALAAEEDGWFGNVSDTPSESSYGDEAPPEQDTSGESSAGCPTPTPVARASLELLGLDREALRAGPASAQEALSSMVSSLNLRRLLEVGELAAQGRGGASPAAAPHHHHLTLSPSSNHAQQLSALARKLANSGRSATPSPSPASVKQEGAAGGGRFSPTADANGGLVWAGASEAWPPGGCPAPGALSPDSAILKLKAAANAVLQDKSSAATSSSSSSSSSLSSSSSSSSSVSSTAAEEAGRLDGFASPFSAQSASSTLAALSKKVSERGLAGAQADGGPGGPFLSLVSRTSSAALLKEVAARAAGGLLPDHKEPPLAPRPPEDVKPPPEEKNHNQTLDLLLPTTPKGKAKASSQGGSPEEGGKPFQCPVCGLVIKRKSYWKRHMVIHTGVKSHQCPMCPFRCARKDNLKSHMKVHQHQDRGETFQCEQCPFTSSRHFSLKLHMRCHQHGPGGEAGVKDEVTTDTEDEGASQGPSGLGSPLQTDARFLPSPARRPTSSCPDMTTKTATDLLMKLSAASQKEALKAPVCVKEEPQAEGLVRPAQITQKPREKTPLRKSGLLSQDIGNKMASELLMKLSAFAAFPHLHICWSGAAAAVLGLITAAGEVPVFEGAVRWQMGGGAHPGRTQVAVLARYTGGEGRVAGGSAPAPFPLSGRAPFIIKPCQLKISRAPDVCVITGTAPRGAASLPGGLQSPEPLPV